jgi:4-amino-4-deoxy-L-arabinose transferase-like glycosyltransferase
MPRHAAHRARRVALLILCTALVLRLPFVAIVAVHPDRMWLNDSASYLRPAVNLLAGHGFSQSESPPFVPDTVRTPTYPLFLVGLFAVAGRAPLAIALAQMALSAVTAVLVYVIGRRLLRERQALIAGLLFSLALGPVVYSVLILSETLFTFMLVAWMALLLVCRHRGGVGWAIAAGVAGGLAVLCRPIAVLLPLPAAMLVIAGSRQRRRRHVAIALVFVVTVAAVIAPWVARNRRVLGFTALSTVAEYNLLYYSACSLTADRRDQSMARVRAEARERVEAELAGHDGATSREGNATTRAARYEAARARVWGAIARETLAEDPWRYVGRHLRDDLASLLPSVTELLELVGVTEGGKGTLAVLQRHGLVAAVRHYFGGRLWPLWIAAPCIIALGATYAGALAGAVALARQRAWHTLVFLLLPTLYFLLMPGAAAHPRFRVPVMPFVCLLAGAGVNSTWRSSSRRRCRAPVHVSGRRRTTERAAPSRSGSDRRPRDG